MADLNSEGYRVQVISQRYIRKVVLEEYVNSKLDEFGKHYGCEMARDNRIKFLALRNLTQDEINDLQSRSQGANAPQKKSLFID